MSKWRRPKLETPQTIPVFTHEISIRKAPSLLTLRKYLPLSVLFFFLLSTRTVQIFLYPQPPKKNLSPVDSPSFIQLQVFFRPPPPLSKNLSPENEDPLHQPSPALCFFVRKKVPSQPRSWWSFAMRPMWLALPKTGPYSKIENQPAPG